MAHIAAKQKTAASIDFTGFATIFYFSTVKNEILSSQFHIYYTLFILKKTSPHEVMTSFLLFQFFFHNYCDCSNIPAVSP